MSTMAVNKTFTNRNSAPWFNCELKRLQKIKTNAFNRAVITKNNEDWNLYRLTRNKYKNDINKAKNSYVQYKVSSKSGDQKGLWRTIKTLVLGKECKQITNIEINGAIERNTSAIVKHLNDFFVNSVIEINCSIIHVPYVSIISLVENAFRFEILNLRDLMNVLKGMNNKKDISGLNTTILIDNFDLVGNEVLQIINKSLRDGLFPKI